eukprot:TRINITY_DN9094_c0_g2_i2.p1 TRINITY_DN9094_c0_g2~~TRINITY_DN9094_c0_g2_i2.p1  ORF type:complete len:149 (+),score=31.96 TRINITY_DN9094_c0_g2_i2:438-884(+)
MIAGLGRGARLVVENLDKYHDHMKSMRELLEQCLYASFGKDNITINGTDETSQRLPNTANFSILSTHLSGRELLARAQGFAASVGSACHSHLGDRPSHILLACQVKEDVARRAIRCSVGRETTPQQVQAFVSTLKRIVDQANITDASN